MSLEESRGEYAIERWDRVFTALSAEPRRQLVAALADTPPERRVLLPQAAMSPEVPPDPERLRINLQHRHLPLLEDGGFIEWTAEPFRAARGPAFGEVAVVLKSLHERAEAIPDTLVDGCQRLERERKKETE